MWLRNNTAKVPQVQHKMFVEASQRPLSLTQESDKRPWGRSLTEESVKASNLFNEDIQTKYQYQIVFNE